MDLKNIFSNIPKDIPKEIFEEIVSVENCRIQRIISKGHSTPDDQWYDQDKDEWVILLQGSAGLLFEGSDNPIKLQPGDYLHIPAHVKHRVEWTDNNIETIWLAVRYN
ncbi:MAG: cupin domain-containing protein [Gammaproteobacteria bacterium]